MENLASFVILSYLTLFILALEGVARNATSDDELRLPYVCPDPLLSGSTGYTITLPHPHSSVIPIISNFANVDWEYDLTNKSFPPYASASSDPPKFGHYNETTHIYVPAIPVTLNAFTPFLGANRFYTLPRTSITLVETLQALHAPFEGPFTIVHTLAPIYLPEPLNVIVGSPFTSTSAIRVCDDRATQITFASDFCASDVTNATLFLEAKLHGTSASLHRILGGRNFTSCEDLEHNMAAAGKTEQGPPWANDFAQVAPLTAGSVGKGPVASMTATTMLWPEPTTWSEHVKESTLKVGATSDGCRTNGRAVAWWKMFGGAAAAALLAVTSL